MEVEVPTGEKGRGRWEMGMREEREKGKEGEGREIRRGREGGRRGEFFCLFFTVSTSGSITHAP